MLGSTWSEAFQRGGQDGKEATHSGANHHCTAGGVSRLRRAPLTLRRRFVSVELRAAHAAGGDRCRGATPAVWSVPRVLRGGPGLAAVVPVVWVRVFVFGCFRNEGVFAEAQGGVKIG